MIDPVESRAPRTRRWVVPVLALLSLALAGLAVAALRADPDLEPVAVAAPERASTTTTTTAPPTEVPPSTPLASPKGSIPVFDGPDGLEVGSAGFWYGYPMTMPIVEEQGDWLRIMLPERPNESTGWVRRDDVTLGSTAYRIVVDVTEMSLTAYKDGFEMFTAPVGVGKESTPTATGSFFVAVISRDLPVYGSVVLDTSGHSEAIESWEGSGDAITSIHGPISASSDAQIGTTGTRISNGCIRMHEADQIKLAVIPLGTPVDIVA